jgi:4-amino-4-deoxy-L-arabinose transferase-like glycosyltransferase
MLATGEWIVPQLHGDVYGEKPPAFFWLVAATARLGAPLDLATRLVSTLAALATVALLPGIAAALGFARARGARAGVVLATAPLFWAYAQLGLLDATSTALVCGAIAAKLARADRGANARAALVVTEGLCLGAALLTKGPVLLLFPLGLRAGAALARATGAANATGETRTRSAARADATDAAAFAIALAVAGAWIAAAWAQAGGDYVRAITLGQAVRRVTGDAPHLRPAGFLLAVTLGGCLPWTLLGVGALRRERWAAGRLAPGTWALLGWCGIPLALLSLLETQQPHYGLPGLPALALLLAGTIDPAPRAVARILGALALLAAAALAAAAVATPLWMAAADLDPALVTHFGDDLALRSGALVAAVALAASVLARGPAWLAAGPWRRTLAATALALLFAALVLARLDPVLVPRALFTHPEVSSAQRLEAPSSLRSAIRVATGRDDVGVVIEEDVASRLAQDAGLVALVWERDLDRVRAPAGALEEVARDFARGRLVVALRAARADRSEEPSPLSPPPASR